MILRVGVIVMSALSSGALLGGRILVCVVILFGSLVLYASVIASRVMFGYRRILGGYTVMLVSYLLLRMFCAAIIVSTAALLALVWFAFKGLLFLIVALLMLVSARKVERNIRRPKVYASEEIRRPIEWAPFVNPELHKPKK